MFEQSYSFKARYGAIHEEDYCSLSDESSESDSDSFCRYSISPITSEEEYSTSESSGNVSDETESLPSDSRQQSHQSDLQPMLTDSDRHDAPAPPLSIMTTYCLCGDNTDKTIKQRYMRCGAKSSSIHYFHSYAVADRISFNNLSENTVPLPSVSVEQLALSLLPSVR